MSSKAAAAAAAAEQEELYDEFGNYIGPDLDDDDDDDDDDEEDESSSSSDEESLSEEEDKDDDDDDGDGKRRRRGRPRKVQDATAQEGDAEPDEAASDVSDVDRYEPGGARGGMATAQVGDEHEGPGSAGGAIVLHEDKVHYPSAEEVYGPDVKTAVLDEDAMDLDTPIVAPDRRKNFSLMRDDDDDDGAETVAVAGSQPAAAGLSNAAWTGVEDLVSDEYLATALLGNDTTRTRRGVALVGHLHHGKTTFVDLLAEQALARPDAFGPRASMESHSGGGGGPRVTDSLRSEQERQLSIKSCPITLALPDTRGKTYAITIVDCPGHANFHDEAVASLRACDGAVLCVDAVEGVFVGTVMSVSAAVSDGLPLCLLLTKVDRLITELKLPPDDAYYKLRRIVEEVNLLVRQKSNGRYPPLSPERGNVAFSSGMHGWSFTLGSIAERYVDHCRAMAEAEAAAEEDRTGYYDGKDNDDSDDDDYGYNYARGGRRTTSGTPLGRNLPPLEFAARLWGDTYLDPSTGLFRRSARDCNSEATTATRPVRRTFVEFVLEPLYKLYAACLGEGERDVDRMLRSVGVILSRDQLRSSARPLLRAALRRFFGPNGGFVDMVAKHIPSPAAASKGKVARCYTGPLSSPIALSMSNCDPSGPLMFHVVKLYASPDGKSFSSFGRIYSGTVKPGDKVRVLGEGYGPDDDEDCATSTVTKVCIPRARRRVELTAARAGNWVLLEGIDANISKTATVTTVGVSQVGMDDWGGRRSGGGDDDDDVHIFAPLKFPEAGHEATLKLAVEPLNPAELPKMVEGLRRVSKSYPMARTRVEESGEHVLFGTGELYLDCAMHDLRHVYSDVEVKVADPVVGFRESVSETSGIKCFAETANKRNRLTMIAEPLDEGLAERLESGVVRLDKWDNKKVGRFFQSRFDWDLLSARSVWAFGPSPSNGTNILLDDTLPSEVDKSLLTSCKSSVVQGFQWATREGPLCEEPVRSTKIKILDAVLADKPIYRGGGQIIPAARRAVHSSLLTASPQLLEPWYRFQIQCPPELVGEMESILRKRRGHLSGDRPVPGTPLSLVHGYLPVIDGFGFETDVRMLTQGQAFPHLVFDHWAAVPGDPLDRDVILHPLEPSPAHCLAREFLIKTRRRKGLSEDVTVSKFFDEGMRAQLAVDLDDLSVR